MEKHNSYKFCLKCRIKKDKQKCPICQKENFDKNNYGVCNICFSKIPGVGKVLIYCGWCDIYYKSNHNLSKHLDCGKISIKKVCKKCKCSFLTHSSQINFCNKCKEENKKSNSVTLYERMVADGKNKIKHNFLFLPIIKEVNTYNKTFQIKECKWCGRDFYPTSPFQNACGKCFKINICKTCGYKFIRCRNFNDEIPCGPRNEDATFCSLSCSSTDKQSLKLINNKDFKQNFFINKKNFKNHIEITKDNINNFGNVSGIWYKMCENVILDVCLTLDIKKEFLWSIEALKDPPNKKYKEMSKINNIHYFYLCSIDSWKDGLIKEFDFATKNKAKYWSPAPGIQMKMMKEIK